MKNQNKQTAREGENIAARYLKDNGYSIIYRNWRFSNTGEIDIIAIKEDTIVFVEVKTKTGKDFGDPVETIDRKKQKQVARLAEIFLSQNSFEGLKSVRLDAIGILLAREPKITHLKNAYGG